MKNTQQRDSRLDLIRVFAVFEVLSLHFFLNNGFYFAIFDSPQMYFQMLLRTLCMSCVPLFLLLTGYLMRTKALCKEYYFGLSKLLLVYGLSSIACLVYKYGVLQSQGFTFQKAFLEIAAFKAAPYSWYINMYVGLFLLIPFLNLAFQKMTRTQKKALLTVLVLITVVPTLVNNFKFSSEGNWFLTSPKNYSDANLLFPDYWVSLFPFTYYFVGSYLSEYKVSMRPLLGVFVLITTLVIFSLFNYDRSFQLTFQSICYDWWGGIENFATSILLFVTFLGIPKKTFGRPVRFVLGWLSSLCLGIYLVSWIFDDMFYRKLRAAVPLAPGECYPLSYYPKAVLPNFVYSALLSLGISLCYLLLLKLFRLAKCELARRVALKKRETANTRG